MATLNDDNEQNNQPTTGGGSVGSGTGKGVGTQQASQVQQNQAPQAGQAYTDVASYLNANQGGGQQLGEKVGQNLTNNYNDTRNQLANSVNTAKSAINQGYTPENTQLIQQVSANPMEAANNADTLSQFQSQLNDSYAGPTSWADYGTQQGKVSQAQQKAGLLNTPGGNNVLVQEVENQMNPGQTSTGINTLDTLLFQGNQGAQDTAKAAAQPYASLTDYLDQSNTGLQGDIANAQTSAQNASQHALDAFTGANGTLTNLNNTINTNTSKALSDAQARQAAINAEIKNLYGGQAVDTAQTYNGTYGGGQAAWGNTTNYNVGNISAENLAALGMTQDQWNALQGQLQRAATTETKVGHNFGARSVTAQNDLSQYLNEIDPTQAINAGNVATKDQYDQMSAIQKLLGAKTPQELAINPLNASLAGTYNPNQLNQFNYNAALSDTQNFADQSRKEAQDEANRLSADADLAHAQSQHHGGLLGGHGPLANILKGIANPYLLVDQELNSAKKAYNKI